jgi:hypothetical protein
MLGGPGTKTFGFRFGANWRAAALLGLISSTFSTLVSQFTAGRIGRDAFVDWMVVATIPFRETVIELNPSWGAILGGIVFHQWADFSWVIVFFVLLGRWTAHLRPWTILLIALPWAIFTSSMEWLCLVPLFPFWQPIFPLEQIYWIGLGVHLTSASMYPIFPALRDWVAGKPVRDRRFSIAWSGLAATGVVALALLAFMGSHGRELPWRGLIPRQIKLSCARWRPTTDKGWLSRKSQLRAPRIRTCARSQS